MNPEPQTNTAPELSVLDSPGPETAHSPSPANDSSPSTLGQQPSTNQLHRKIAKLPKLLRDRINGMMDDSLSYHEIARRLQQSTDPPLPYPISEKDLSRWKSGGYLRYLAAQEHIESLSADRETALDMVATDDTTTLPEATLQIIAGQYFQFLGGFNPESLKAKLAEDPLKYTRFLNVFARLTREILLLKKHRQASAQAALAELKPPDPDRDVNDKEFDLLTDKWDAAFKRRRRARGAPTGETGLVAPLPAVGGPPSDSVLASPALTIPAGDPVTPGRPLTPDPRLPNTEH